jgi:UDP-4-amino-4,6-dideoxy-N-acetyl-beta-L-altrosamine transaminase
MTMIPYGRQEITDADIQKVVEVLRSDFLTQGPLVPKFEDITADYCKATYAVATNSATSALHLACLALNVGTGDWVWTTPNTFVATANCALYCGASVDFIDIDSKTYNLCPIKLENKLIEAKKNRNLPKVVIPTHFAGQPCNMPEIRKLSLEYGFKVIEDASHALGANYSITNDAEEALKIKVGSCFHSDITVFSFHSVKIITTGEGGMALTNNDELANTMRELRTHGITKDKRKIISTDKDEIWNYQQIKLGYNYRMTDIQAALGCNQILRLDSYISRRREIASIYNRELEGLGITLPWQSPHVHSSYHLYPIGIKKENIKKNQRYIYTLLNQQGVAANLHYIPIYRQPYFEKFGFKQGYCSNAESYYKSAISLPIFPGLTNEQQFKVINILKSEFEN